MMGVPTFYTRLLDHPDFTRERCAHMRLFISGSAPLLASTHDEFAARTGHAILERYGMTETGMNTSNPYDGDRIAGTVGFPLPGVELRIADPETGRLLGTGEIGMIEVKGPNVFKGYWRMPEKTEAEFRPDGFFITGDVGKIDERGYVHIVGRGKDLIITGGFNVYPKEIELAIDAIEGVQESAVIGVPHPDFGEGVTAVVVPEPGAALTEEAILAGVRDTPRQVQAAQARALRRRAAAQHHGQGSEERPARAVWLPLRASPGRVTAAGLAPTEAGPPATDEDRMGPLEGMKVVDLTHVMAGPTCTLMLADMGADVIKIEKAPDGDDTRRMLPPKIGDEAAAFLMMNRNKRGIVLDLKTGGRQGILRRLVGPPTSSSRISAPA